MRAKLAALLALVVLIIVASWTGARYFGPRQLSSETRTRSPPAPSRSNDTDQSSFARVNLMVNFGNGTIFWFNNTRVPKNYDFYQVTYNVTKGNVVAEYYDSLGLKGYYVQKILGVGCQDICVTGQYWSLWVWNVANACWDYSSQGVSLLKVSSVVMVAWYYTDTISSFPGRCA